MGAVREPVTPDATTLALVPVPVPVPAPGRRRPQLTKLKKIERRMDALESLLG